MMKYKLRIFNLELRHKINVGNFEFQPLPNSKETIEKCKRDNLSGHTANAICKFKIDNKHKITNELRDEIHRELGEILLLMSFCQRRHINWFGEGIDDEKFQPTSFQSTFFGKSYGVSITILDRDLEHFINHALNYLKSLDENKNRIIKNALWNFLSADIFSYSPIMAHEYPTLWITFEVLINSYWSLEKEKESIYDANAFKETVKEEFKDALREIMEKYNYCNNQKAEVYPKLEELNRYSIRTKAKWFLNKYLGLNTVKDDDLKIFIDLRNMLFHKGISKRKDAYAVEVQTLPFKSLLERVFLGILNYKNDYFYSDWKSMGRQNFNIPS